MAVKSSRGHPKLPVRQLAILAICRFAEPLSMTSVYPYLPEMIESFGVQKKNIARWAGMTSAAFNLSQCLTAVLWGRASDKFGRKPAILLGLTCTMVFGLVWGMSTSLPMAITARALAGACNGNVGIIRTVVAELVPEKELQPTAFTVMPLVWNLGSIFGPSLGGMFARPAKNLPNLFGNNKFFIKFPFVLPNLVSSVFFLVGITTGVLFLHETLEAKRNKPDRGRVLGKRLVSFLKRALLLQKPAHHPSTPDETSSLLDHNPVESDAPKNADVSPKPALPRPTLAEVFTRQSVINLMAYSILALHFSTFDQLLPIFLHQPRQDINAPEVRLPFKFSGGFDLNSGRIGTLFSMYGICGCFIQFLVFPPIAKKVGILRCLKFCGATFPVVYFLTPFTALIRDPIMQQVAMGIIMLVKCFAGIFAFPCSTILLTNSAVSLRILGTLNGFAVSTSSIGRAAGPALTGAAFTWGLERGYIITSWWLLAFISVIGAIPVWYLTEMDGFPPPSTGSDDNDEVEEETLDRHEVSKDDSDQEVLDSAFSPLSRVASRTQHSDVRKISGGQRQRRKSAATSEVSISSLSGLRDGIVVPGGSGLAASNFGHGTGGSSFS